MLKRVALLLVLALVSISVASAKNYRFRISEPCVAGSVQLQPGEYTLKVEGNQATLLDRNGRPINAPAKLEQADRKFEYTAVGTSQAGGTRKLNWVHLGGTNTRVVFTD